MKRTEVFNTPFELGVRMVFLLAALHPRKADLQRLMYLDYAAIYSADLGGPESLHAPVPLRSAEYATRREVIENGLCLMALRSFVNADATDSGILYSLGENGASLIELIPGEYANTLAARCTWVAQRLGDASDQELQKIFGVNGALWPAHFVGTESPGERE